MREIHEVADGCFVATSRREHTTSTIVVHDKHALLIDPCWDPDELSELADLIEIRGWRVVGGVATHAHHDHLLWHPRFGEVPRWASAKTVALAREHRDDLVANLGANWPADLAALVGAVTPVPSGGLIRFGTPVRLIEHDGHAPGHTAVLLPELAVLVAGDMLSDVELPLPLWPDDLDAYLAGLDVLATYVEAVSVLVPGHGTVSTAPRERLAADRRYLRDCAERGDSDDPRRANPGMAEVHRQVVQLTRLRPEQITVRAK